MNKLKTSTIQMHGKSVNFVLRKIIIFFTLFAFIYQSIVISWQYLKYDTLITSETEVKPFVDIPAMTFCTALFKQHDTPIEKNYTALKLMEITRNATNDWLYCHITGQKGKISKEIDCSSISPVIMSRTGLNKFKCFTFFSQINKANKNDDQFLVSRKYGRIFFQITLNQTWWVHFTMHSPLMIPSLKSSDFVFMQKSRWY